MTFTTEVEFEYVIEVKNNKIVGVLVGTDDDNAVNFKQLTLLSNKITELTTTTNALERQITKVLNTHAYYYKQIFEFYLSSLDPD